jgi:hypothetical protein
MYANDNEKKNHKELLHGLPNLPNEVRTGLETS